MTNRDRADRLITEASEILRELSGLLRRQAWNLAVTELQGAGCNQRRVSSGGRKVFR